MSNWLPRVRAPRTKHPTVFGAHAAATCMNEKHPKSLSPKFATPGSVRTQLEPPVSSKVHPRVTDGRRSGSRHSNFSRRAVRVCVFLGFSLSCNPCFEFFASSLAIALGAVACGASVPPPSLPAEAAPAPPPAASTAPAHFTRRSQSGRRRGVRRRPANGPLLRCWSRIVGSRQTP